MKPIRFLTANHVLRMHYTHIFPLPLDVAAEKQTNSHRVGNPLLQPSYLESALTSPRNHHFYNGTVNPFFLVSLVAEKLALNHPFYDGNKRTALFSMDMFLRLNGVGGILVRRKDLGCRSQLRKENASVYASRSSPKLSSKERALADAMVDIATGHMQSDGLSMFISEDVYHENIEKR
ncbi:hypothetical protein GGR51DRAFT_500556 [Nemania sp. FL0031]|nr:hypothetical protein GGR51DRAFT_500556 [Nemania sp. FL0031]